MNKLHLLTVVAGLTMAFTTIGAQAQFAAVPGNNNPAPAPAIQHNCADDMGHMRSVHRADIDAIAGQKVYLIHVCEDLTVVGRNTYGPLFVNGNVDTLRQPIGRNRTLMVALHHSELDQHDVVSLRFGRDDTIVLYVYDRDMN